MFAAEVLEERRKEGKRRKLPTPILREILR
jgi:hypothetical protein